MATVLTLRSPLHPLSPHFPNPNPNPSFGPPPFLRRRWPISPLHRRTRAPPAPLASHKSSDPSPSPFRMETLLLHLAAPALLFFLGLGARASPLPPPPSSATSATASSENQGVESCDMAAEKAEDEEFRAAFESWKSKTYALTVPLRIVALRGSVPPSWFKDFIQAQGRRSKLISEFRGSLETIFSELSLASKKGCLERKSTMAADIVSIGDSWLSYAIREALVEPIRHAEGQDWFKSLSSKWKVYLCRNDNGDIDSNGYIWGAPYRWGSMVIAYKKNKFRKHNLGPIEDWGDLWRPELAGKISMVDSPREVVGSVLKYMGASYNTKDMDSEVSGGRSAVLHNLTMLQKQVRIFDSVHYLKAFGAGDVWVAVGWSSDIIPAAKRMSNVTVIVPKSGASLWADIWAVPFATRFASDRIGGRVRSASPLIHQWFEFCLQTARGLPFQQEVIPGASPFALEHPPFEEFQESSKGKPKLDTNLIKGVPPPEILCKCEFLEPLSGEALEDFQWLVSNLQKPGYGPYGWIRSISNCVRSLSRLISSTYLWR